ncbi:helix-turn-helix domain-containing protein [Levilactobacillus andaensis]|uniref:helix-turn-helix domain-containing protein n=1 Tax=Levilactobacillus andaensis TaxID=2799570 RepID=UPI00194398AE|nr:hypothetical protein [Levilactobacillus andaensis]
MKNLSMPEKIKALLDSDITPYQISKDTGVPITTIAENKNGKRKIENIRLDTAVALADYYDSLGGIVKPIEFNLVLGESEDLGDGHYRLSYETEDTGATIKLGQNVIGIESPDVVMDGAGSEFDFEVDIFMSEMTHEESSIAQELLTSVYAPQGLVIELNEDGETVQLQRGHWFFMRRSDHKPGFVIQQVFSPLS